MEGEKNTSIEFNVNVETYDVGKDKMVNAMATGGKLTKADAGRVGYTTEDWLNFTVEPGEVNGSLVIPKVTANYHSKESKTETGL